MDHFEYRGGRLHAEEVSVDVIASEVGTPVYVYSRATLERHWHAFDSAMGEYPHLICYSVKANGNLAVLNVLARLGSGFDIVSVGELERVLAAGGNPQQVIFSGVGKSAAEMRRALEAGIAGFNVESAGELERLNQVAEELGVTAPVSIRANPDVDALTHPYIATGLKEAKFGVPIEEAKSLYQRASGLPAVEVRGVTCHIGSQLTDLAPYLDALDRVLCLIDHLEETGIGITTLNLGGGLGIRYQAETPPEPAAYAEAVLEKLKDRNLELYLEPGRAIAGNAGILLTRIDYLKHNDAKSFAVVDAAMNDLLRPALYGGWHEILATDTASEGRDEHFYDVVGPVCESADFLGKERCLRIQAGDLLAVRSAGAYAFCMSSNYNARPRACEVMVDRDKIHQIRRRESIEELYASESLLPDD